jgi:hypothetical protein
LDIGAFSSDPWKGISDDRILALLESDPKALPFPADFIASGTLIENVPDCLLLGQTGVYSWVGAATTVTYGLLSQVTE